MKKIAFYLSTIIVLVLLLITSLTFFQGSRPSVHAQTGGCPAGDTMCLSGWVWSSNAGWISFNSSDSGAGGGSSYDVSIDPNTGDLGQSVNVGGHYAWSGNVGWISFKSADVTPCNGNTGTTAKMSTSTGAISGWFRVVSEIGRSDGWDGCVELSGSNHSTVGGTNYAVDTNGYSTQGVALGVDKNKSSYNVMSGYAWGANVIGWLQFSPSAPGVITTCEPDCGVVVTNTTPDLQFAVSGGIGTFGSSATVPADVNGNATAIIRWVPSNVVSVKTANAWDTIPSRSIGSITSPSGSPFISSNSGEPISLSNGLSPSNVIKTLSLNYTYLDSNQNIVTSPFYTVSITITPYVTPPPAQCSLPARATWCQVDNAGKPIPNTPPVQGVANVGSCVVAATRCQFYCQAGYKLNNGGTACIKSSIHEI